MRGGAPFIVRVKVLFAVAPTVSVAVAVNVQVQPTVGVPSSTPVAEWNVIPGGTPPGGCTPQVKAPVPPVAARVVEYALPTVPLGSELVVIDIAALIVMLSDFVATTPTLSVTRAVKVVVPALAGVPERSPAELRLMPDGTDPTDTSHVNGAVPPLFVIPCE